MINTRGGLPAWLRLATAGLMLSAAAAGAGLAGSRTALGAPGDTPTPDPTSTMTATPTKTPTVTPTPTLTAIPTQTQTPAPTFTPAATSTVAPTLTVTPMPKGVPVTIDIVASPNTLVVCPGKVALTATVKDSAGANVPDGTVVKFITNGGSLGKKTAVTSKGVATNVLSLTAGPTDEDAPIYSVSASAGVLVISTNIQAECSATPVPASSVQCSPTTGTAAAQKACKTAIAGAPPPQSPITAQAFSSSEAASHIRPPSTGDGALLR